MGQPYTGGRRRGSGALQWMLIGVFVGLMCGILFFFILLLTDMLPTLGEAEVVEVTREVQIAIVVTATQDPNATQAVQVITATPEPTTEVSTSVVVASPTSTTDPANITAPTEIIAPTEAPATTEAIADPANTSQEEPVTDEVLIPAQLAQIISPLVTIPGGQFELGTTPQEIAEATFSCQQRGGNCLATDGEDSTPIVRLTISTFGIEQTEVSFEQYVAFLNWLSSQGQRHTTACSGFICIQTANENPDNAVVTFDSANYNVSPGLQNHPVYGVTWYGAEAYCRAIGRRLPTEAEWEFAARGSGERRRYPWGNDFIETNANTRIPIDGEQGTTPVGQYAAGRTPGGILDMAGNVAEWVQDWYDPNYYSQLNSQPQPIPDPQGPTIGLEKVLRGGSWNTFPFYARTYHRQSFSPAPDIPGDPQWPRWTGFRCAADGDGSAATGGGVDPSGISIPSEASQANPNAAPTVPGSSSESNESEDGAPRG